MTERRKKICEVPYCGNECELYAEGDRDVMSKRCAYHSEDEEGVRNAEAILKTHRHERCGVSSIIGDSLCCYCDPHKGNCALIDNQYYDLQKLNEK